VFTYILHAPLPQRPILLKGHGRPLTRVRFNRDGDLLVTCSRDDTPNLWYSANGERLGTFAGHQGSVWDCDISWDSTRLVTASSDCSMKIWDMVSCTEQYNHSTIYIYIFICIYICIIFTPTMCMNCLIAHTRKEW
jgi:WD40 repeat protein